jgi:hypothetical protein
MGKRAEYLCAGMQSKMEWDETFRAAMRPYNRENKRRALLIL